ncbi:MAG: type II toxin-antitoxin system RelE/ParE family toxin [Deltaproteobacteria bacterium]|nr:type II toxin-antitoxin system RelE/ParE family toxin [Deltaproteobacteria bacterium]
MTFIYEIRKTAEYEKWFAEQQEKTKVIVDARLQRIAIDGHFGTINVFGGLIELKWKSGLRIYTHRVGSKVLIVLLGGNKNGQDRDISQAKKVLARFLEEA